MARTIPPLSVSLYRLAVPPSLDSDHPSNTATAVLICDVDDHVHRLLNNPTSQALIACEAMVLHHVLSGLVDCEFRTSAWMVVIELSWPVINALHMAAISSPRDSPRMSDRAGPQGMADEIEHGQVTSVAVLPNRRDCRHRSCERAPLRASPLSWLRCSSAPSSTTTMCLVCDEPGQHSEQRRLASRRPACNEDIGPSVNTGLDELCDPGRHDHLRDVVGQVADLGAGGTRIAGSCPIFPDRRALGDAQTNDAADVGLGNRRGIRDRLIASHTTQADHAAKEFEDFLVAREWARSDERELAADGADQPVVVTETRNVLEIGAVEEERQRVKCEPRITALRCVVARYRGFRVSSSTTESGRPLVWGASTARVIAAATSSASRSSCRTDAGSPFLASRTAVARICATSRSSVGICGHRLTGTVPVFVGSDTDRNSACTALIRAIPPQHR